VVIEAGSNQYVMAGWTDPLGQTDLVGKAQYDFDIVEISQPQVVNGGSNMLYIAYATVVLLVLLAVMVLVLKLRHKPSHN
jgi:hypothetical protein